MYIDRCYFYWRKNKDSGPRAMDAANQALYNPPHIKGKAALYSSWAASMATLGTHLSYLPEATWLQGNECSTAHHT